MSRDCDGEPSSGPDASAEEANGKSDDPMPSRLRLWVFRIIAATVAPLLLLGLLEAGLRIGGYGYPTSFFVEIEGADAYTSNLRFGWRFFPRSLSRQPWPIYLPANKADDTYRIFILGGSAAQGVPDPAFSFGRVLGAMLAETYPDAKFEVVTVAMTAINSHVALPIARDCARHDPDLFIVYMGNNEVIGPYGAGTVFQGFTDNLTTIRANIALRTTKLGQLIEDIVERLPGRKRQRYWGGMKMFQANRIQADAPGLEAVYRHFRRNLQDICRAARRAGADTLLCTVAVNLRHCAPFASAHRADLTGAELARWDEAYQAGIELEQTGDHARAIAEYLTAAAIDDRYAELQFRLGRRHLAAGRPDEARQAFTEARDLDTLRFRADSNINRIIREVAAERQDQGVGLVDAETALADRDGTNARAPAGGFFYEHVHLTFEGNYELARAIFPEVVSRLPEATRSQAGPRPAPPSLERCAQRLGLTAWQKVQMLSYMLTVTNRSPFTEQLDHAESQAVMEESLRRLESQITPATAGEIRRALAESDDDPVLHTALGRFLLSSGEYAAAARHFRIVLERLPDDPGGHLYLAQALLGQDRLIEAGDHFDLAAELAPDRAGVCANIAELFLSAQQIDLAEEYCRRSLAARSDDPKALSMLGRIHLARGQWEQAADALSESLQSQPDSVAAHQYLALALYQLGRLDQAARHYQKAIELEPDNEDARRNYALVLIALKEFSQAAQQYRRILEIQPDSLEAITNLSWLLATSTDPAVRDVQTALDLALRAAERTHYREAGVLDALAVAYAEAGQFDLAIETVSRAVGLAIGDGQDGYADQLRERRDLYRRGTPLSQGPPP